MNIHNDPDYMAMCMEPKSKVNWGLVAAFLICAGFWAWVGYNVVRWVP